MSGVEKNPPPRRSRYGWETKVDGEWHLVRRVDASVAWAQGSKNAAARVAAYKWAEAHAFRAETRTNGGGAELYVRFTPLGAKP